LHVRYVNPYKLCCNWISVVRLVSLEVETDQRFVFGHFPYCCFLEIVSLWSQSIWIRIILNTVEPADQRKHWNQMPHKQNFQWKNAPQAKLMRQNALQARMFRLNLYG